MDAIYARQSLDKKDSISIDTQIEFCEREISEDTKRKEYVDRGYSGKNTNRPYFEELMGDIKKNIVRRVIVYKLDRISRSVLDFANMMKVFENHNVEFVSSTEKFDTSTPIGRAILGIIVIFAQLERETIQQRIRDSYYARGKKGFYLGGRVPLGYTKKKTEIDGKKTSMFVENEEQSCHIAEMFKMYATTNISLGQIAKHFNEKGFQSAKNKNWTSDKISRMLKNPTYVKANADVYLYYKNGGAIIINEIEDFTGTNGCFIFGKREPNERKFTNVENHVLTIAPHPGIIDSKVWLKCQHKLDTNKQIKNKGKGKYTWLSGLVKCGFCGFSLRVVWHKDWRYFRCSTTCGNHKNTIYVEEIEKEVRKLLMAEIRKHEKAMQGKVFEFRDDAEVNKLKIQLVEVEKKIGNILDKLAASNDVLQEYINRKIIELDYERKEIVENIGKIEGSKRRIDRSGIFEEIKNWDSVLFEKKKEISQQYIDKILIFDKKMEIIWKV